MKGWRSPSVWGCLRSPPFGWGRTSLLALLSKSRSFLSLHRLLFLKIQFFLLLLNIIKVIFIFVVVVAGCCLITTSGDDKCYISHNWWLPAGSGVRLCLRFLIMAVADTRWQMSWDRYPTSTGGPDWEKKVCLILYLSSWVCLRCWDLKKESSSVVLVKMGCNYSQHWEALGQRCRLPTSTEPSQHSSE